VNKSDPAVEGRTALLDPYAVGLIYELREGLRQLRDAGIAPRLGPRGLERWTASLPRNSSML
jgi:hypothetical protein